jgi:enoyl-CoA hydratase/carnithine racemase
LHPETGDTRIRLEMEGRLAVLTIDRPEKLNALDYEMILALERAAQLIELNKSVRVAIMTGTGDRSFCAGGDIAAWADYAARDFGQAWVRHGHRAFDALARLRQPLIAALNGHILGGGLELAACADFRIAEEHIKVGQPESGLGIIPGWSGTQRAVRRFGHQVIRRMSLLGEIYGAEQALAHGLVDSVVPIGASVAEARQWAEVICSRGPIALELVKALINSAEGEERERPLEAAAGAFAAATADLREGVQAFRQKRKPEFEGK